MTHKFMLLTFLLIHNCTCTKFGLHYWHSYFLFYIYYLFYTYKFLLCKHFGIPDMCTATQCTYINMVQYGLMMTS